jgi:hypothetical protein
MHGSFSRTEPLPSERNGRGDRRPTRGCATPLAYASHIVDTIVNDQRLSGIIRSPNLVEDALRIALADGLTGRRLRLGEIDARSFAIRALDSLRVILGASKRTLDAVELHQLEAATIAASGRLFSSKLGRRLFTIDVARLEPTPRMIDAAVIDTHGRRHVVRIEACSNDAQRVDLGRVIASHANRKLGLHAPRVHLFSLRDGRLRSFTFAENIERAAA